MTRHYSHPVAVTVPRSMRQALIDRARQQGTTVAALVKDALQAYLAQLSIPEPPAPPGDADIAVRLSERAQRAIARQALVPRHTLSAVSRRAITDVLGIPPGTPDEPPTHVSTRLSSETLARLHAAADAYTREAIIQRALAAYRRQQGG